MLHGSASIQIKPERLPEVLDIYSDFVPRVTAEEGCIEYLPTVDIGTEYRHTGPGAGRGHGD